MNDRTTQCMCPVCPYTEIYKPVCGSNGRTYATSCLLQQASCNQKKDIRVAKDNSCGMFVLQFVIVHIYHHVTFKMVWLFTTIMCI